MGWHEKQREHAENFEAYASNPQEHQAKFSHELIAGAAAYEAAKAYQDYREKNGQPPSHDKAKEIFAGLAGAFIDRAFETRGLDFIDKEKAKREATKHFEKAQEHYNPNDGY